MSTQDGLHILAEDQLLRQIVDCFMELDQVSVALGVRLAMLLTHNNTVRRPSQPPALLLEKQDGEYTVIRLFRDDTIAQ